GLARGREIGAFAQEAVARMDRVGARLAGGLQHGIDVEITSPGRRLADEDRFVGLADVQAVAVDVAVDGDRRDASLSAGPQHPASDFTAVGDENFAKERPGHRADLTTSGTATPSR